MSLKFRPDPKPPKREPKSKKPLVRTAIKKKFVVTGEKDVFEIIWSEREHICTNCKTYLGEDAQAWFFAHIKSKKKFPELRLEKTNIMLHCLICHHEYDNGTKEKYNKRFKN